VPIRNTGEEKFVMNIEKMRQRLKSCSAGRAGMILVHNGVVRNTSRAGDKVSQIQVSVNWEKLEEVMKEARRLPGVIAVEVEVREGVLQVGEDIMLLGIAGDIRENTIAAMAHVLDRIKKEVTFKKESMA